MTAQQSLDFARARLGYYAPNDPQPGSEAGRWLARKLGLAWLAGPSPKVWWCMCFASMCTYEGGGALPGGPWYNTDDTVNAARKAGQLVSVASAQPGDLAIFDWRWATAATDHVGIVEANPRNGTIVCIEGNTSSGSAGSQSAGNGVWRRIRSTSLIRYVVRPTWPKAPAVTPTKPAAPAKLDVDGVGGPLTVKRLCEVMGTPVDTVISQQSAFWRGRFPALTAVEWVKTNPRGSQVIAATQRAMGLDPDGLAGIDWIRGMEKRYNTKRDDVFGPDDVRALQIRLNEGRF